MKYLQVILELYILLQIFSFEACISNTFEKEQCFAEIFKNNNNNNHWIYLKICKQCLEYQKDLLKFQGRFINVNDKMRLNPVQIVLSNNDMIVKNSGKKYACMLFIKASKVSFLDIFFNFITNIFWVLDTIVIRLF